MQKKMGKINTLPSPQEAIRIMEESFDFRRNTEKVSLFEAKGRVLAEDILADAYFPEFDRSAMDGYSVIAKDLQGASKDSPVVLKLTGDVPMGKRAECTLSEGTCVYTPTGAAVPEGCESVAMVEDTAKNEDGTVSFFKEIEPEKNVIRKGAGLYPGKQILPASRTLNVADIGTLATIGVTEVPVVKKPVVGILCSGDELIGIEETPKEGQIRNSNSLTLALTVEEAGAEAKVYGIVKDQEELLLAKVKEALSECDMVLISGGSSMGEKDVTEQIVESVGTLILHGIRMKPGKPVILGNAEGKPVVGVPGNPVSAYFVTRVFVKRLIRNMLGAEKDELFIEAVLTKDVKENKKRSQFDFGKLSVEDGKTYVTPVKMSSGLMASTAVCDAFFVTPIGNGDRKAGETVTVHPL